MHHNRTEIVMRIIVARTIRLMILGSAVAITPLVGHTFGSALAAASQGPEQIEDGAGAVNLDSDINRIKASYNDVLAQFDGIKTEAGELSQRISKLVKGGGATLDKVRDEMTPLGTRAREAIASLSPTTGVLSEIRRMMVLADQEIGMARQDRALAKEDKAKITNGWQEIQRTLAKAESDLGAAHNKLGELLYELDSTDVSLGYWFRLQRANEVTAMIQAFAQKAITAANDVGTTLKGNGLLSLSLSKTPSS